MTGPITFPFAALVGMDDMREALLLNAVDPRIGGVLIRGEKGTAKSTAVRALPYALPAVSVVRGCRFRCDPAKPNPDCPDGPHIREQAGEDAPTRLVEMPVGATEDRVVGSLDLEKALTTGVKSFEPGLLAAAHRGILYLDEVNLLNDHLVDVLLDASALGVNYVERDGVSVRHPATFLLVGTMNPEEGELRPQLLDRFGLTVDAAAPRDPQLRVEIVRRRLMFDADPASFAEQFADAEKALVAHIVTARNLLTKVTVTDAALQQIASVCAAFDVDGLRADIVTARTAAAYAAWHGRDSVTTDDIRAAARLTLPHRRRRNPFDAPGLDEQRLKEALADPEDDPDPDPGPSTAPEDNESVHTDPSASDAHSGSEGSGTTQTDAAPGEQSGSTDQTAAMPAGTFRPNRIEVPGLGEGNVGRRSRARVDRGRTVGVRQPDGPPRQLHLLGTLHAAAAKHGQRELAGRPIAIEPSDLREAICEERESNLVVFVVDASGSMAARARMSAVKGAVQSLLLDCYQRRDKLALIVFRGDSAQTVLPPTSSSDVAATRLAALPTGGRTPLAAGLLEAHALVERERLRDATRRPLVLIVTDGRYTPGQEPDRAAALLRQASTATVVIDCEDGPVRLGLAHTLAGHLGGTHTRLNSLAAAPLADTVRAARKVA